MQKCEAFFMTNLIVIVFPLSSLITCTKARSILARIVTLIVPVVRRQQLAAASQNISLKPPSFKLSQHI